MSKQTDYIKFVADYAFSAIETLLSAWLPDGRREGHNWSARNPCRNDKRRGSFKVDLRNGSFVDFADDSVRGGDLVALRAYLSGQSDMLAAAADVAAELNLPDFKAWATDGAVDLPPPPEPPQREDDYYAEVVMPVPVSAEADLPPEGKAHPKFGRFVSRSLYRDENGAVLGAVYRFVELSGKKNDVPCTLRRDKRDGSLRWIFRSWTGMRPLYGLDALAAKPNAPVLVVEGEKCKNAADASGLLDDWVVVTWSGGGKNWDKSDWAAVNGREVVLWPDADAKRYPLSPDDRNAGRLPESLPAMPLERQIGWRVMTAVGARLQQQNCTCRMVDIGRPDVPDALPDGYDIADALADGDKSRLDVLSAIRSAASLSAPFPERSVRGENPNSNSNGETAHTDDKGAKGEAARLLADLLKNYAQIGMKERVISLETGEILTRRQLERIFGKEAVLSWFHHAKRHKYAEFEAEIISKERKLAALANRADFADVLKRYIYLDGTTDAYDTALEKVITLNAVKAAIPDQYEDWSKSPDRQFCPINNYVFDPVLPPNISYGEDGKVSYINLFKGLKFNVTHVKPFDDVGMDAIKAAYPACKNIIGLVEHICSGNGHRSAAVAEWVLNWLACRFRQPEIKPATALVFVSEVQGVGKSTFGERVIKALFGDYTRQLDQNALESRFNSALACALVTIFEEISPSDERMNIIGKLKNMITSDVVMIERKQRDAEKFADYNSFVIFSNDERSIPIESNDRRFMVSCCRKKYTDEQYAALAEEVGNNGIEAFAEFLYALPLRYTDDEGKRRDFHPHSKPLLTDIKRRMININKRSWEAFLDDWRSGDLGVPFVTCSSKDVWALYRYWCAEAKTYVEKKDVFFGNLGKRLWDYRTAVKLDGVKKNIRIFAVQHSQLSQYWQDKCPYPDTGSNERTQGSITVAEYYGRQVMAFHKAVRDIIPHLPSL